MGKEESQKKMLLQSKKSVEKVGHAQPQGAHSGLGWGPWTRGSAGLTLVLGRGRGGWCCAEFWGQDCCVWGVLSRHGYI